MVLFIKKDKWTVCLNGLHIRLFLANMAGNVKRALGVSTQRCKKNLFAEKGKYSNKYFKSKTGSGAHVLSN